MFLCIMDGWNERIQWNKHGSCMSCELPGIWQRWHHWLTADKNRQGFWGKKLHSVTLHNNLTCRQSGRSDSLTHQQPTWVVQSQVNISKHGSCSIEFYHCLGGSHCWSQPPDWYWWTINKTWTSLVPIQTVAAGWCCCCWILEEQFILTLIVHHQLSLSAQQGFLVIYL